MIKSKVFYKFVYSSGVFPNIFAMATHKFIFVKYATQLWVAPYRLGNTVAQYTKLTDN